MINHLQNMLPLSSKESPENIVSMSGSTNQGKHVVICNVWMKKQQQMLLGRRQISDMLFEISYIDKQGEIE